MSDGGAVGMLSNWDIGWYTGDPRYEAMFLSSFSQVSNEKHKRSFTIGDVLIRHKYSFFHDGGSINDHQTLNRFYFGDPAAFVRRMSDIRLKDRSEETR